MFDMFCPVKRKGVILQARDEAGGGREARKTTGSR
jgi:hypothetical protein